ncbi:TadE/TadG family type IV pilus assembly protein [Janthinobacterium sp. SUN206]|uniref:TadE/TadG family type IV pilus assembly protein n=1 Tax=Janthinobacterium sp. SUN206 TaxID=3014787 RepID=UPI002712585B|nr:TadE/TadG family type IV pilus assembly protein [Janthinobacterium sp. SUN206]MDO8067415.1 TadE/TadG family type IV pilus assembly protein [Janthinobacterium sp. SUN206]
MRAPAPRFPRRTARGIAAIEFAIVLPLLALLLFMLADLSRAIQAKTILLNISREGANLSARATSDLSGSSQGIMNALAASTPPLDMHGRGMIYITKIMGYTAQSGLRNIVLEQYRWDAGAKASGYLPASQVWQCGSWRDGTCTGIAKDEYAPTVSLMQNQLADGELIYAVETFYNFDMLFGTLKFGNSTTPVLAPNLTSMTVF